jgi:hypothetical protein
VEVDRRHLQSSEGCGFAALAALETKGANPPEVADRTKATMIHLFEMLPPATNVLLELQSLITAPELLPWIGSAIVVLFVGALVPVIRWRRQATAMEWRRTLAARARA